MTKQLWKKRIIKACKDAGTYQKYFDDAIETLSWILEQRDNLVKQYEESGGEAVVEHVNVKNQTNLEQNPCLRMINDFNRDIRAFLNDLGLTPKGLKAINESALDKRETDALTEALKELR